MAAIPASPEHHHEQSWKQPEGKFLPSKKILCNEEYANKNSYKPSSIAYNPVKKLKAKFIPFTKEERKHFLSNTEFLGCNVPFASQY